MFVPLLEASIVAMNAQTEVAGQVKGRYVINNGENRVKSYLKPRRKKIRKQTEIKEEGVPAFYVFNYEGGGWSVIAADRRVMPVMAYAETGEFSGQEMPAGLIKWQEDNRESFMRYN